ncbi:MAG: ParA family protein [Hydrotalea sp.]|nr:ParA family protein [Hydrotalea sp.]
MAITVAFTNQKGGVAKTTTTVNLATALAASRKRVLVIDFDPQGNAATALGVPANQTLTIYEVLTNQTSMREAMMKSAVPGLFYVCSSFNLAGLDHELYGTEKPELRLKNAIESVAQDYDFVFIDCPPSLNLLTVNAMVAANELMIPMQCEFYALEGLSYLLQMVQKVKKNLNPNLRIEGIVFTMYDERSNLTGAVVEDVKQHFQKEIYQTVVPRNVKVAEAPSHGKSVLLYDLKSAGARAHVALAKEFLARH